MARCFLIIAVLVTTLGSAVCAQDAGSRQPGVWYEGRQLGYVPGHLRQATAPTPANRQMVAAPQQLEAVQPASYYEQEAFDSYPEPAINSSWDPPNCGYPACCGPPPFWVRAELLSWWIDDMNLPALVTTSPLGTAANQAGVLGQPGTRVLFGNDDVNESPHLGGRFTFGRWLDPCESVGIELSYFFVGQNNSNYSADNFDHSILARPVFSTQTMDQASMLVAYPNLLNGSIDISASSRMQGFDALTRWQMCNNPCSNWNFLAGYRYLSLNEQLLISQNSRFIAAQGNIVVGTEQRLFDSFATDSQFNGAQIGVSHSMQRCWWTIDTQVKLALGNTHSQVDIDGRTRTTVPGGGSATFNGGLLAQQTNIGRHTHDELGFVPEFTLTARRDLGCNMQFLIGYNLIYWTGAARLGNQIDTAVSQFPPEPAGGAGRPRFNSDTSGVLLQGLQLGLEARF
ncbi:BBP7 family outer membrane beta-barrel protein [Anatilimnocola floriformis]|uniref:BBP7 family outer membrane beta-barrel protein n=1 Tax=Anatilimnocola floriformis TaxID=2948575 RepID=UPI0020C29E3C|nr:BBP7 family outer membrane beta-barrel protein [Anatilimnocola floriformis]